MAYISEHCYNSQTIFSGFRDLQGLNSLKFIRFSLIYRHNLTGILKGEIKIIFIFLGPQEWKTNDLDVLANVCMKAFPHLKN